MDISQLSLPKTNLNSDNEENSMKNFSSSTQDYCFKKNNINLTFDDLLSTFLNFGLYQKRVYFIMALIAVVEGSNIITVTVLIPVFHFIWDIPNYLNTIQISLIFVTLLLGAITSGKVSDHYGRRLPIIWSTLMLLIFSFLSTLSPEFYTLIVIRVILGFFVGFLFPLIATYLTEITPVKTRGRYMVLIQVGMGLGNIYGIAMGRLWLSKDLKSGNWRILIVFCTFPGILAFILSFIYLKESPRYDLIREKYLQAFETINEIKAINMKIRNKRVVEKKVEEIVENDCSKLNSEQMDMLIDWSKQVGENYKDEDIGSVKALFKGPTKLITILLWFNWFTSSFVYYGIVIFLPLTLSKLNNNPKDLTESNDNLAKLLISTAIELISVFCAAFLIEFKYFGRKNSMVVFYFLSSIAISLVYIDNSKRFIIWATLAKVLLSMTMIFCYQYTGEVYPTKYRTTGIGFASGFGRFATIFMPVCYLGLIQVSLTFPFLIFGILALISTFISMKLPFDTTGKELDSLN